MVKQYEDGYFINGQWFEGIYKSQKPEHLTEPHQIYIPNTEVKLVKQEYEYYDEPEYNMLLFIAALLLFFIGIGITVITLI
ncbi:MAG TPA: hypothetical protein PK024_04535 [Methanospirillum sp.]|uniref:hypothetical protein n=1 Tax=Methanospirillum sp. TaxID=45200 RepID=UPI002B8BADFC|nr:hypothetical protein [Methanospirillum sp.]HOJ96091.1 hypothetical protein [Methanospirillum sp.]HPP76875.1 hypothetical protein [Methanospirillum sp.]